MADMLIQCVWVYSFVFHFEFLNAGINHSQLAAAHISFFGCFQVKLDAHHSLSQKAGFACCIGCVGGALDQCALEHNRQ